MPVAGPNRVLSVLRNDNFFEAGVETGLEDTLENESLTGDDGDEDDGDDVDGLNPDDNAGWILDFCLSLTGVNCEEDGVDNGCSLASAEWCSAPVSFCKRSSSLMSLGPLSLSSYALETKTIYQQYAVSTSNRFFFKTIVKVNG